MKRIVIILFLFPLFAVAQVKELVAAIEAAPDSLRLHEAYIKAAGLSTPVVVAQYEKWMKQFPRSAIVPYAIGKAYTNAEDAKAKPYLLKAVALNPSFTEAWGDLWADAQRWGDFSGGMEYLRKAMESDPSNAMYAFYYAHSFKQDHSKWETMIFDVVKRFPANERGAQGLYWLAVDSRDSAYKAKIFDTLKNRYSPEKFSWSRNGMYPYFDLLLDIDPAKAVALATELGNMKNDEAKEWAVQLTTAQKVLEVKKLIAEKKGEEAFALISSVKVPWYFGFNASRELLKAESIALSGNNQAAYDSLIVYFSRTPEVKLKKALSVYGTKLGKGAAQIDADIWKRLDAVSKPATPFTLKRYLRAGTTSLSDYKGRVVLLTYWFPGCGPCRGEFPHFENALRRFPGRAVDYIGINIVSEQNDYVIPFMKSSGYTFTPLEDVKGRAKGNLDNGGGAPANFLIDGEGRLIFGNFMINANNEDKLEMMIELLLNRKA
ncbi:TlpA family protein disulfide reductase [Chitinophaga niabensis]|uniref:Thiol-disulfide isomerase or thioredoxin n=1 Tax=Chitinophaga niabensis TaxID=536979 RepID=A0A1N6J292_9BACT|nr:TlpA disulfide reductase family protein [Chitinophaga niabensis]SIO38381.1 Thiol-disulfide isomerase or thioredoxin [Chitinophaga niabensis]